MKWLVIGAVVVVALLGFAYWLFKPLDAIWNEDDWE